MFRTAFASSPLLGSLVLLTLFVLLADAGVAGADSQLRRISFEGVEAVPIRVLEKGILTHSRSRWRPWQARPELSKGVLEEDRGRIVQAYHNHGYYSATARFEIVERGEDKPADVVFYVTEGEPVRLAEIDLVIDGESPIEPDALVGQLPIEIGDVFTVESYRRSRGSVLEELANLGRPAARLEGGAEVVVEARSARIKWRVTPGPPVGFGPVRIEGLSKVDEHIVRREIAVVDGASYTARALEDTRTRLLRLQLFRYVSVQPDKRAEPGQTATPTGASDGATEAAVGGSPAVDSPPAQSDPAPQVWPVIVQVEERPQRSISLGGGWASGLGPRGSARWTHRNFFGGARSFITTVSGSEPKQSATMQLSHPYLFGTRASLVAEAGWRRRHRDTYDTNTADFRFGPRRALSEKWLGEAFYRFGWTDVRNVSDTTSDVVRAQQGSGLLSGVGLRFRRTSVDHPTDPKRGTWLQLGVSTNLKALGSDFDWMRYDAEARGYLSVGPTVAALRVRYQVIDPMGSTEDAEVPLGERLFLGGPNTGRGFPYEKLGPLDVGGDPVGGLSSLLISAEWRVPVWGPLTVVGFVDAGLVSLKPLGFDVDDIGIGTGAGLAVKTPIGPIAVYVAYPVRPVEVSQRVRVALSIGHSF